MVYVYDILLNFNKELIEYFEWEDSDSIKYIKKVALFKVNSSFINDMIYKEIKLSNDFVNIIPKYEMNGMKDAGSVCLFSDGFIAIGVLIREGKIISYSRLLLDEEREALEILEDMDTTFINYEIIKNKSICKDFLTRNEKSMKDKLKIEIDNLYKNKNYDKLFYLYYEYSGSESRDITYVYNFLKNSLSYFENKHKVLFDILLLSNASLNEK